MSKFPMNQDDEERQIEQARRCHGLDDADGIQCNRCGETGLYWQPCVSPDGRSERMTLFSEATRRRHACSLNAEMFDEVPE